MTTPGLEQSLEDMYDLLQLKALDLVTAVNKKDRSLMKKITEDIRALRESITKEKTKLVVAGQLS